MRRLRFIVVFALLAALFSSAARPGVANAGISWRITDLGTLGGADSQAYAESGPGFIVGQAQTANGQEHAFLYNGSTMTDLGTLGGGATSVAYGASNGYIVGATRDTNGTNHAFAWCVGQTNSAPCINGMSDIDTGGLCCGNNNIGYAVHVDLAGVPHYVGTADTGLVLGPHHAFLSYNQLPPCPGIQFCPFGPSDLGTFCAIDSLCNSSATAVNSQEHIAGFSDVSIFGGGVHAVVWQGLSGPRLNLGTLGGNYSQAFGIDDSDDVVGYAQLPDTTSHAFLAVDAGQLTDLGTLPGRVQSVAYGISNLRRIVGKSFNVGALDPQANFQTLHNVETGDAHAFFMDASIGFNQLYGGKMVDLNDVLPAGSGWVLQSAQAVDDNLNIVGYGLHNGQTRAFLMQGIRDSTPPTSFAATITPPPNSAGWQSADATVTLGATDNTGGSGVESITYSATGAQTIASTTVAGASKTLTINTEGSTTITYFATDNAGNSETPHSLTINLDKTPPTVTCGAADSTWHASDVSIACTAADAISGLANASDASFSLTTSVPNGTETANAATNSYTVCDVSGNCTTAGPVGGNMVDKKPPSIAITSPTNTSYTLKQAVAASYTCSDGGSGVASCAGPVASGSPVDTSSVGAKTFTVNAADKVGNASSQSVSYSVAYGVKLAYKVPMNVKTGSTVPIKIQLVDAAGNNLSSASLGVQALCVVPQGTTTCAGAVIPYSNQFFTYMPEFLGYQFNVKTTGLAINQTYQLLFRVAGEGPSIYHADANASFTITK